MVEEKNAEDLGWSDCMGPQLRNLVESKLLEDLRNYLRPEVEVKLADLRFDWSESCIEGHNSSWLDGSIENFSGITIVDLDQNLIAEGWMEFIETKTDLEVFWCYLYGPAIVEPEKQPNDKVPQYIWDRLDDELQRYWIKYAPTSDLKS